MADLTDIQVTPDMKAQKDKWSVIYKICCTASREFKDRSVVFGGVGISFLAVAIAKLVNAPNMILVAEAGYVGFAGITSMGSPADNSGGDLARSLNTVRKRVYSRKPIFLSWNE